LLWKCEQPENSATIPHSNRVKPKSAEEFVRANQTLNNAQLIPVHSNELRRLFVWETNLTERFSDSPTWGIRSQSSEVPAEAQRRGECGCDDHLNDYRT